MDWSTTGFKHFSNWCYTIFPFALLLFASLGMLREAMMRREPYLSVTFTGQAILLCVMAAGMFTSDRETRRQTHENRRLARFRTLAAFAAVAVLAAQLYLSITTSG